MPGEEPSSVSVSFTGDDAALDATLDQLAEKAQTTAEDVQEAFSATTLEVDDTVVNEQLDKLVEKVDELGEKHPEIKPGVEDAADEDTKAKLDDLVTKADELDAKRPEIKPGVEEAAYEDTQLKLFDLAEKADTLSDKHPDIKPGVNDADYEESKLKLDDLATKAEDLSAAPIDVRPDVNDADYEDAKLKLDELGVKAAELDAEPVEIRTDVNDADYADTVAKLEALKVLADSVGDKNVTYNVKLSGSSIADNASQSDVQSAARDIAGDLGDLVLKSMATVAIGAVVMPAAEVVASGLIYALGGALTSAFSGANFALALTGSKNPVRIKFQKEVDTILTAFDKAMAPYTAPALHSLLAPLSAYLTDVAPDVKGFGQGLEAIATTMTTSLNSPAVKKIFSGLGAATAKEMAQFGPVLAEGLAGLGQLLVAAEPLILSVGNIMQSATKHFAGAGAGKDESKFFGDLAKDLTQYGPLIHTIFSQIGTDLSQFATDIKPLEGPALKAVDDGLVVLGDILKGLGPVISAFSGILTTIEKLPGGNTAVGLATLAVAFEKTRAIIGDIAGLAVKASGAEGFIKQLGNLLGGGKSSAAATMQTAADTQLDAAKIISQAATKMAAAGGEEEAAGAEEVAAGSEEDVAAGGAAAGIASKVAAILGTAGGAGLATTAGIAALIALPAVITALSATRNPTPQNVTHGSPGQMYGTKAQQKAYEEAMTMAANESTGVGSKAFKQYNDLLNQLNQQELANVETVQKQYQSGYKKAAQQAAQGFIAGMLQYDGETAKQSASSADKIIEAFKKELKISSPSVVFSDMAEMSLQGYANKIGDTSLVDPAIEKLINSVLTKVKSYEPQFVAVGSDVDMWIANGITSNAGAINSAVNGALGGITGAGSGGGRSGGSVQLNLNGPLVQVQSPNGTLPPQIMAQVEAAAQQAADDLLGSLNAGLFGQ